MSAIESLYKKLTQQLKFQLIEVRQADEFNIFVAFETINNRGRQLSNLENFMEERWNIKFQSDDKLKILLPGVNNLLSDSGTNNP